MTVQGRISDIQRQSVGGGTRTKFRLHSSDGKETSVETQLDFPYRGGDTVQVSGEIDSDLVLTAMSISSVSQPAPPTPPKPFPWIWVIAACALLIVGFAVKSWMSGGSGSSGGTSSGGTSSGGTSGGSTLTVMVRCLGKPVADYWVGVGTTLPKKYTNAEGECVFTGLQKGTYQVTAQNDKGREVSLDGSSPESIAFSVDCAKIKPPIKREP